MNTKTLIDEFVIKVEDSDLIFERKELSSHIRVLEDKLNVKLPNSFRYLLSNYAFVPFAIEPIYFYSNCRNGYLSEETIPNFYNDVEPSKSDLSNAVFQDKVLYDVTSKNGFIQFARPFDESYDPICFDAREKRFNNEYPIVRLDHEEVLCNEKIKIVQVISGSFYRLASDFINN